MTYVNIYELFYINIKDYIKDKIKNDDKEIPYQIINYFIELLCYHLYFIMF